MDHDGEMPSSLEELDDRLRCGETLTIEAAMDSLTHQLYPDTNLHLIVKQGEQEHQFHHLEAAVVGLLSPPL